jgi:hypothetical protein
MTLYTRKYVANEVEYIKSQVNNLIDDWRYVTTSKTDWDQEEIRVPVAPDLEELVSSLTNLQQLIKEIVD